ncbi:sigma-70 family RNA polymerase sigma factor [Cohnella zeiphila]|uniref:RNA polymerase sigma factor n=1 Tax=Cohnella zeiphila TaxID=2761120 RepID=A0A7X0VWY2_9BACL|nr:RNA polymerase sigma factor [Cohnella zeiphila]
MQERELFETYRKEVYRTCYFMLHHAADAEDVCQDVFVSVFRHDWRRVEFLRTWIIRVTVNRCLNYIKLSGRRKRREIRLQLLSVHTAEKAAETVAMEQESARDVLRLLQRLPAKLRAAAALRYINEYSLTEIADILDVPVGTVKSRLNKCRKLMRKEWQSGDAETERSGEYETNGSDRANLYSISKR